MSKLTRVKWGEIINRLIKKRRAKQMKSRVMLVLVMLGAFIFFSAGVVKADDLSEMKEQIKALQETINAQQQTIQTLNSKVQGIETKQESQAQAIKKVPELTDKVAKLKENPVGDLLGGVQVGAHLKFAMLDQTIGKRNGVNQKTDLSAGFVGSHNLILYFGKELADWLRIDIQPEVDVSASATPSLGSDITRVTSSSTSIKIHQAFMTALLPKGYELKVGTFNAMYSEDYAKETWWHYFYNMNTGKCSSVAWHDSGVELYKNFDFDKWSLPVYLSLLNGGSDQNVDNNDAKTVLLHIAPEFFQSKLRLLGSLGVGYWSSNKNSIKLLGGLDWKYKKFNLLGEYIFQEFDNVPIPASPTAASPTAVGKREGYWIRGVYTFNPKWRALIEQSYFNNYKAGLSGQTSMLSDKYYSTNLGVDYSITPNSTIIGQYEIGDASRSNGSESLRFNRYTLGWRTTF